MNRQYINTTNAAFCDSNNLLTADRLTEPALLGVIHFHVTSCCLCGSELVNVLTCSAAYLE